MEARAPPFALKKDVGDGRMWTTVYITELFSTVENKGEYILLTGKTKISQRQNEKNKKYCYPGDENDSRFVPKCTQITKFIYLAS